MPRLQYATEKLREVTLWGLGMITGRHFFQWHSEILLIYYCIPVIHQEMVVLVL